MKALSIRQPWAWLILFGGKDIENRPWWTAFRGTFLIHAAKGMTRDEYEDGRDMLLAVQRRTGGRVSMPGFDELPRGGIVGRADLVACLKDSPSPWFMGKFGFKLANPAPMDFVPYRGQLGLFDVPMAVAA